MRVAIAGGGISGLAAAWELRDRAEVTVFEPGDLGGRIRTTEFLGGRVDEGPDAFLTRVPEALALCEEVGLGADLVTPAAGRAQIWWAEKLRPLPEGLVLGVPTRVAPLVTSGLLSPAGVARSSLDLVLPRRADAEEATVWSLVAGRFGAQVAERLVDPLVGGIHAGTTRELGAKEVAPQIVEVANRSRSLLLGLRGAARRTAAGAAGAAGSPFMAPRDGMGALVEALTARMREAGVAFVAEPVTSLQRMPDGRVAAGDLGAFDRVVLATPAHVAAGICGDAAPQLGQIESASVVLVTAALSGWGPPPGFSGFLVPRASGRLLTAASYYSAKWPLSSAEGRTLVRLSSGRSDDTRVLGMDDDRVAERLVDEFGSAVGSTGLAVEAARVSRWPLAFPQFRPGHAALVSEVVRSVGRHLPGVTLAGGWMRGSGIPACIASGRAAARESLLPVP